jgi:hypothetical protein
VDEHVGGSIARLNETIAAVDIEKFNCSGCHDGLLGMGDPRTRDARNARAVQIPAKRVSWRSADESTSASGQQQINTIVMWGRCSRLQDTWIAIALSISGSHKRQHGEEVDGGGDHNEAM